MREQTLRASSSYPDRAEYRQGHGKVKSSGTRSRRGTNLGLLGRELGGLDLLGAALGLSSEAVNILVDGRDHAREHQYGAHLAARLKDAGIPATWLDQSNPQISPAYLSALRKFAAASNNKAPTRRANFRRIARAFDGREQVLADALEMVVSAVSNVTEGQLELDDGRFGHMNPILMRAGFPDGWLEQAEPDLTEAMLLSLEQLATDDYERKFEEVESTHTGQVFVSPQPEPQPQPSAQPTAAPVDKSKETVMAPKTQQQTPPPAPFQAPAPEFKAGGMPTSGRPMAHPSAGAARVPRTVLAAGRKLPGAGPAAKSNAAGSSKPAAKANAAQTPAPQGAAAPAPAPAQTPAPTPAAASNQSAAQAAPDNRRGPNARGTVSKEASLARAEALEKLLENARRGAKAALWRDVLGSSLAFWGNIRRGAVLFRNELAHGVEQALGLPKGWLDNPTFPPPQLAAFMSDKDAPVPPRMTLDGISDDGAQSADQDGAGADTDAAAAGGDVAPAPAPTPAAQAGAATSSGTKAAGAKAGAPARDATKPFARSSKQQTPKVTMHQAPPSTQPVFKGAAAAGTGTAGAAGTSAPEAGSPAVDPNTEGRQLLLVDMGTPAPGASTSAQGSAAAASTPAAGATPAAAPAQVAATPASTIAPAAAPVAGQPGPLTQALMSIITAKAAAGTFTEADALGLINKLMAQ